MRMQRAVRLIYPPQCLSCDALTESEFALCPSCWGETPFIGGLVCDLCGTPLPGEDDGRPTHCDDCLTIERPWRQGRAALVYRDGARRLVMALKHGDRTELAPHAAAWMAQVAVPLVRRNMLVAPVPLHWTRLLRRRYNQAALLSAPLAERLNLPHCPDLLLRPRRTPALSGPGRAARFAALEGAIVPHPRRQNRIAGRSVLLVDDVMTSGATLAAATAACFAARAAEVCVLALARTVKEA